MLVNFSTFFYFYLLLIDKNEYKGDKSFTEKVCLNNSVLVVQQLSDFVVIFR